MGKIHYIEPKYNSGEKVAGGTLAIYANDPLKDPTLLTLYSIADFDTAANANKFEIANPVPIDNNGINSSAIFYEQVTGLEYYILRDARNAIIRQGYIIPYSWQATGTPPGDPNNPWGNALKGDPFWGYEVVPNLSALSSHEVDIGRPLFLATNTAGDKSGGLVVYQTSGNPDSVLTFASSRAGTVWRAREEFINYSYLVRNTTASFNNAFQYIDNLNALNGWNYGIRLDQAPRGVSGNYNSKLLIDSQITANYTNDGVYPITLSKAENLIITCPIQTFVFSGTGKVPFLINVRGGSFNTKQILDSNGNNVITGYVSELKNETTKADIKDLTIGKLMGGIMEDYYSADWQTDKPIENFYLTAFKYTNLWKASDLANLKIETLVNDHNSNKGIKVDADIRFKAKGYSIKLEGDGELHYIDPGDKVYVPDKTVKANNAEFYNNLAGVNSNVKIAIETQMNSGDVPGFASNDLLKLEDYCAGTVILDDVNSGKLYIDSDSVNVVGLNKNHSFYLKNANKIVGATVIIERQLDQYNWYYTQNSYRRRYDCKANEMSECRITARTNYSNWTDGSDIIFLSNATIKNCEFINSLHTIVLDKVKMSACKLYPGVNVQGFASATEWNCVFGLGSGTSVTDSEMYGVCFGLWGDGDSLNFKNIHFDNNKAMNGINYLNLLYSDSRIPLYSDGNSFVVEDVTFKGNNHNGDQSYAFIPLCKNDYDLDKPFIKGHIEVTGYYDYSNSVSVLPTEKFPPEGKNFPSSFWFGAGEYTGALCMYTLGETLKYTDTNNGSFVTALSRIDIPQSTSTTSATLDWDYINANPPYVAQYNEYFLLPNKLAGNSDSYGIYNNQMDYFIVMSGNGSSNMPNLIAAINSANPNSGILSGGQAPVNLPNTPGGQWSGDVFVFQFNDGKFGAIKGFYGGNYNYWGASVFNDTITTTTVTPASSSWSSVMPNAITNYVMSGDGWIGGVVKCLLCCNCNVKLYRIRE